MYFKQLFILFLGWTISDIFSQTIESSLPLNLEYDLILLGQNNDAYLVDMQEVNASITKIGLSPLATSISTNVNCAVWGNSVVLFQGALYVGCYDGQGVLQYTTNALSVSSQATNGANKISSLLIDASSLTLFYGIDEPVAQFGSVSLIPFSFQSNFTLLTPYLKQSVADKNAPLLYFQCGINQDSLVKVNYSALPAYSFRTYSIPMNTSIAFARGNFFYLRTFGNNLLQQLIKLDTDSNPPTILETLNLCPQSMSTAYFDQLNLPALGLGFVDEENYVWIACASNDSARIVGVSLASSPMQITQSFDIANVTFKTLQQSTVSPDRNYFYVMTTEPNFLHKIRLPARPWVSSVTTSQVTTSQVTTSFATSGRVTTGFTSTTGGVTPPAFPVCFKFNVSTISINNNLCFNVQFQNCRIETDLTLNNSTLVSQDVSVGEIKQVFSSERRCQDALGACRICTYWNNLILNSTLAEGCGNLEITCFSQSIGTFNLGCFENREVVPECFGSCPNSCSFNGVCNNGFCRCNSQFTGNDCSRPIVQCPNNCTGPLQGTCVNGVCNCDSRFDGPDCSNYLAGDSNSEEKKDNSGLKYGLGFGITAAILLVVLIGVLFYMKKMNSKRSYRKGSDSQEML